MDPSVYGQVHEQTDGVESQVYSLAQAVPAGGLDAHSQAHTESALLNVARGGHPADDALSLQTQEHDDVSH